MKNQVIILTFLGLAAISFTFPIVGEWVAPKEADDLENPYKGDSKATEKGKKTFEKMCWTCHGMEGKGDGPAAANLDPQPANYTSDQVQDQSDGAIFWKISNGRGNMVGYESVLSEKQRWELVNYIRELGK